MKVIKVGFVTTVWSLMPTNFAKAKHPYSATNQGHCVLIYTQYYTLKKKKIFYKGLWQTDVSIVFWCTLCCFNLGLPWFSVLFDSVDSELLVGVHLPSASLTPQRHSLAHFISYFQVQIIFNLLGILVQPCACCHGHAGQNVFTPLSLSLLLPRSSTFNRFCSLHSSVFIVSAMALYCVQ